MPVDPVRVPKASDVFADQLRRRIFDGELEPGTALPNERALAESAGLSRTVVREALRILEIEGLVRTRPGRNCGTVVQRPDPRSLARSIDIFIRGRRVRFLELLEAREQIEPACAELAARYRDADDLRRLEEAAEAVRAARDDVPAFLTANAAWHVAVAETSHNELLGAFMRALSDAVRAATDIENFNSDEVRGAALVAHDRVMAAIRAGDAAVARRAMERHVRAYREQVLRFPVPTELGLDAEEGS